MRQLQPVHRTKADWIFGGAAAAVAALGLVLWPGAPQVRGQQPAVVTAELDQALARVAAAERVPVLIEVTRAAAPLPLAAERDLRALEHASNLAGLYALAAEDLRRDAPSDVSFELVAGEVIWIGGAVTAQLTPQQVRALQRQPGVQRIYYDGLVQVNPAGREPPAPPLTWAPGLETAAQDPGGSLPWGLVAMGAPELWSAGATGEGTVVATIDSGVDGEHPLLWRKWRGLSTSPQQAWFDPWGLTRTPVDDDNTGGVGHGTIVMSTAVGSLEPGDTLIVFGQPNVVQDELEVVTGVAPGAEWVAANAFEVYGGVWYTRRSVLLQSMQWVLDPDGDPATLSDVPDALNNSWGFRPGACDGVFDRAIDALELSGVPVVFAAGNRSAGFDTVAAPGERADLLLNAFTVGAATRSDGQIVVSENSLGGPSPCAPGAIKPEVVAPGEVTLVAGITRNRAQLQGPSGAFTSWAAPHATGALALLAGLNPSATANALKDALFSTAEDLDPPGPDNRSGAGFIDLPAAAERIGGVGGVQLAVEAWSWDSTQTSLALTLFNSGLQPFAGGTATLQRRAEQGVLAEAAAPAIGPRSRAEIAFEDLSDEITDDARLTLRLESLGATLMFPLTLSAPPASSIVLVDGAVEFSIDAHGRIGGTAGGPGFVFLGSDWLAGGALLFASGDRVSDAAYVDVQQQSALKSNPIGSDTDWREIGISIQPSSAAVSYSDDRALQPLGATVLQSVDLVSLGDSAAFVALSASVRFGATQGTPLAGLFVDWDVGESETVAWDDELGASVMAPVDSPGPYMALTTAPRAPTTHAPVPLGTPQNGLYTASANGVLARLEGFTDAEKGRLLALGGASASDGSASDWAQMVGVGPLQTGDTVVFVLAAGGTRDALRVALDSARAFVEQNRLPATAGRAAGRLEVLPPYPNPFDPLAGVGVSFPFLFERGSESVNARLEIYTIDGWLVHSESRALAPDQPLQPFSWSGVLESGEAAASGVYGFVLRVGNEAKTGKFVLLK